MLKVMDFMDGITYVVKDKDTLLLVKKRTKYTTSKPIAVMS